MSLMSFEAFGEGLSSLGGESSPGDAGVAGALAREAADVARALEALSEVSRQTLAELIKDHPRWVPFLASCVDLGLEQLKRQLQHRLGSSGWLTLARRNPERIIATLDEGWGLVAAVQTQGLRQWRFADVLVERARWSQRSASRSIVRGRKLENVVEETVQGLGLPYEMRVRFQGKGGRNAPCDFAIPRSGDAASIVGAVKGFDSTGSKLSDAVRELKEIAETRLPRQFVFGFVDGIGWRGRRADLRRIYDLWVNQEIDGLYSLSSLDAFQRDLAAAARRLGLIT
jgi:hypothetical protein